MDLTSLSLTARKGVILVAVGIIALIVIYGAVGLINSFIKSLNPPPPPTANKLFGTLKPIVFEQPLIPSSKFTYTLETVDSQLPAMPNLFEVYTTKSPPSLFQSLDQAKARAKDFGFVTEPTQFPSNNSIYLWQDSNQPGYTFTMDIVSGDFRLVLNPAAREELLTNKVNYDSSEAISRARDYLKRSGAFSPTFEGGDAHIDFLNITPRGINAVSTASQANSYRVDFFPAKINSTPVVNQKPQSPLLNITLLANSQSSREVVFELNYQQFEIDLETKGTYDIKSSEEAWVELKDGQAVVVKNSKQSGSVAINTIYLAYFKDKSRYLKPVYVFEGISSVELINNDFMAILPAITVENKAQ